MAEASSKMSLRRSQFLSKYIPSFSTPIPFSLKFITHLPPRPPYFETLTCFTSVNYTLKRDVALFWTYVRHVWKDVKITFLCVGRKWGRPKISHIQRQIWERCGPNQHCCKQRLLFNKRQWTPYSQHSVLLVCWGTAPCSAAVRQRLKCDGTLHRSLCKFGMGASNTSP